MDETTFKDTTDRRDTNDRRPPGESWCSPIFVSSCCNDSGAAVDQMDAGIDRELPCHDHESLIFEA